MAVVGCSGKQLTAEEYSALVCGTGTTEAMQEIMLEALAEDDVDWPQYRHILLALDWLIELIEGIDPPDGFEDFHDYLLDEHRWLRDEVLEADQEAGVDPEVFVDFVSEAIGDYEHALSQLEPPIQVVVTEQEGCQLSIAES